MASAPSWRCFSFIVFLFFNARMRQELAEKRATEAQLRLLQAQIEPHFLFNTLANVQSADRPRPPKARQMLAASPTTCAPA
jgi:LytS/YehU family sensor histidine kinase